MGKKILLAEDDKFLSKMYQTKLINEGFDVVVAMDGEEALLKVKSEKPDIMLLDMIMPKKTGFEVMEAMKADEEIKNIPVIVLSNLEQESEIEKINKSGAVDFILKANISLDMFIERVKKHLGL